MDQGMVYLSKEDVSDMITAEFVVKGVIPGNYRLEITEMNSEDQEPLRLIFKIHKEYVN